MEKPGHRLAAVAVAGPRNLREVKVIRWLYAKKSSFVRLYGIGEARVYSRVCLPVKGGTVVPCMTGSS